MNELVEVFITVAKLGSFHKAADELYLSPASVMLKINQLEKNTGLVLFNRTKHGSTLTKSGKYFYSRMLSLKEDYQNAIIEAAKLDDKREIKVAYSPLTPNTYLSEHLSEVMKIEPDLKFKYIPFLNTNLGFTEMLSQIGDKVDIVLTTLDDKTISKYNCQCVHIKDTPVLLGGKFPKDTQKIDLSHLEGKTINIPDHVFIAAYQEIEKYLTKNYPKIKIRHVVSSDLTDINYAINHDEFILATAELANAVPQFNVAKTNWSFTVPYVLIYSKNPTNSVKKLIQVFKRIGNN